MANRVAKLNGVFLKPGISKNNRQYTAANIGKAVQRIKEKLASPDALPISMAVSHGAAYNDNATSIVGRITSVEQLPDGSATFEADVPATEAGKDIATLTAGDNPFIKGVSIRGAWMSDPVTIESSDGTLCTTADDLDIFGIDFTGSPGVEGAGITHAELAESANVSSIRFFTESVEEFDFVEETETQVTVEEAGNAPGNGKLPYGTDSQAHYADPGYQKDKKKRYPLSSPGKIRSAWSYINVADNASKYTPAQLARIKSKIKSAAKKANIDIASESAMLETEIQEILEAYADMTIYNGEGSVSASGSTDDAGKLAPLAKRVAFAAIQALNALDPDADGDIDLIMPDGTKDSTSSKLPTEAVANDDNDMDTATANNAPLGAVTLSQCLECGGTVPESAMYCPMCGKPVSGTETDSTDNTTLETPEAEVPASDDLEGDISVSTDNQGAAEAAPVTLSADQFAQLLAAAKGPAVEAAPVAPVVPEAPVEAAPVIPATPAVAEGTVAVTPEQLAQMVAEAVAAQQDAAVESFRAQGAPRKGFANEGGASAQVGLSAAQLHELYTTDPDAYFDRVAETVWKQKADGRNQRIMGSFSA